MDQTLLEVDEHSGRTRVIPVFSTLQAHGGPDWVTELLHMAEGIQIEPSVGDVLSMEMGEERLVPVQNDLRG